jgi:hypothetical protein
LAVGAAVGATAMNYHLTDLSQTARDDRRYLDAIALLRQFLMTPDALDLRDQARQIIARHEAATNRKDT